METEDNTTQHFLQKRKNFSIKNAPVIVGKKTKNRKWDLF